MSCPSVRRTCHPRRLLPAWDSPESVSMSMRLMVLKMSCHSQWAASTDKYMQRLHTSIQCLVPAIAAALFACPGTSSSAEQPVREVSITLQSDGKHCAVDKARILCSDLVSHFRDVLKLPAGTRVRLRAGRAAPHESVKKVMDLLDSSEYPLPAAYIAEPKPSTADPEHASPGKVTTARPGLRKALSRLSCSLLHAARPAPWRSRLPR